MPSAGYFGPRFDRAKAQPLVLKKNIFEVTQAEQGDGILSTKADGRMSDPNNTPLLPSSVTPGQPRAAREKRGTQCTWDLCLA